MSGMMKQHSEQAWSCCDVNRKFICGQYTPCSMICGHHKSDEHEWSVPSNTCHCSIYSKRTKFYHLKDMGQGNWKVKNST